MTQLPTKTKTPDEFYFAGFKSLNSTPIPDEFFDVLAVRLSEAELRVLLYIMRRTFGFKKTADAISLNQLTDGIRRRDGSLLDSGTGLSRPSVLKAVAGLQAKGIIAVEKRTGLDGRNEVNVYSLRFQGDTDNTLAKATFPQQRVYSQAEYFNNERNFLPTPDPQFVSAQPLYSNRQPDAAVEQRRSGVETATGVKTVYPWGKAGLLGEASRTTRAGQIETVKGVKKFNPQDNSLQILREQPTVQQPVLRSAGALALQASQELEPVEVEVDGDLLYINFRKLVTALVELGLNEKIATTLAYDYPEAYLWEKIELTRRQVARSSHQTTVRNTAGYLRRAIEEDYQPQPTHPSKGHQFPYTESLGVRKATYRTGDGAPTNIEVSIDGAMSHEASIDGAMSHKAISQKPKVSIEDFTENTAPLPPIHRASSFGPATDLTNGVSSAVGPAQAAQPSGGAKGGQNALYAELWEGVKEDLAGRFRLESVLPLLEGAWLWLEDESPQALIVLSSAWQERQLGMSARSAIGLAVRQRLGPGYSLRFVVGTS